jgi:hypothetical protein
VNDIMKRHLKPLIGRKITRLFEAEDGGDDYGFELDNGTLVWVLQDAEGNGPGFLDLQPPPTTTKQGSK